MLAREWNGRMHRVAVLADGFAWNGTTYPSLSKIALRHHGHPLERTPVLRPARQAIEGSAIMKTGGRNKFAAPSTPVSPPTKGWNRTSTPFMPSMMPHKPISGVRRMPAGPWFGPNMTMAGSPVATPTPGLQRLLEDLRAGKVDIIVVYKVDRLTRSLADFAKLVELFDQHGVSFVR